jgi:hypothetical protein
LAAKPHLAPEKRYGFAQAKMVTGAALLSSAALSVLLLFQIGQWGGPNLLRRVPPELVVLRLMLSLPFPAVATVLVLRLPRSRRALAIWMIITAVAITVQIPFLFPEHVGGAVFILLALAANLAGLILANGQPFRTLCTDLERERDERARQR